MIVVFPSVCVLVGRSDPDKHLQHLLTLLFRLCVCVRLLLTLKLVSSFRRRRFLSGSSVRHRCVFVWDCSQLEVCDLRVVVFPDDCRSDERQVVLMQRKSLTLSSFMVEYMVLVPAEVLGLVPDTFAVCVSQDVWCVHTPLRSDPGSVSPAGFSCFSTLMKLQTAASRRRAPPLPRLHRAAPPPALMWADKPLAP